MNTLVSILPSATLTNTITNLLHALFLTGYFIGAIYHYLRGNPYFSLKIVCFFALLVLLKLLGSYVHYFPTYDGVSYAWIWVGIGLILLNYCMIYGMAAPSRIRWAVMLLTLLNSIIFIYLIIATYEVHFILIASSLLIVYGIVAFLSHGLLRFAFIGVIVSNVVWIVLRFWLMADYPIELRYDNDIYYFMLIASTYMLYKAVTLGYWKLPKKD